MAKIAKKAKAKVAKRRPKAKAKVKAVASVKRAGSARRKSKRRRSARLANCSIRSWALGKFRAVCFKGRYAVDCGSRLFLFHAAAGNVMPVRRGAEQSTEMAEQQCDAHAGCVARIDVSMPSSNALANGAAFDARFARNEIPDPSAA